jgi:amino-acid N-acetyltransferase
MDALPIDSATLSDADPVLGLLRANNLPVDGVLEHLGTTLVARQDGTVVGCAALELYAEGALLRSVAVASTLQGHGLGQALTAAALQLARDRNVPAVYLLTTTAGPFFPKFGFERIERRAVPQSVQASIEFRSACPSSATVMRRVL